MKKTMYNKHRAITIPLYDIGSIVAGFYVGYCEGKGMDLGEFKHDLMLYGPAIISAPTSIGFTELIRIQERWMQKRLLEGYKSGNIGCPTYNHLGEKIMVPYKKLTSDQQSEVAPKIFELITSLKKAHSKKPDYLKISMVSTGKTALESLVGYTIGRIYSGFT